MDWNMLIAVSQTVAAIGILLSLVYVGKQVKETNAMTRSAVRVEVGAELNAWQMAIATSPELSSIVAKLHFNGLLRDQASGPERIHIAFFYAALLGAINIAHQHMEDGIMSSKQLEELFPVKFPNLELPYLKSVWPYLCGGYRPTFRSWLEKRYGLAGNESS